MSLNQLHQTILPRSCAFLREPKDNQKTPTGWVGQRTDVLSNFVMRKLPLLRARLDRSSFANASTAKHTRGM